jgi:hypothetical protein
MEFNSVDNFAALEGENAGAAEVAKEKKSNPVMEKAQADFQARLAQDPNFKDKVRSRANDVEITRALAYGDKGGIILNKTGGEVITKNGNKKDGVIESVSGIVGYTVKNVGTDPIAYDTVVCHKNEEGIYVEEVVHRVLNAGQTADLPKQYVTALLSRGEFSLRTKNGFLKKSSRKGIKTLADELKSWYFQGDGIAVNGPDFKFNISTETVGTDGSKKWVVKPEFIEAFGSLENPEEKKVRQPKAKKSTFDKKDVAAFYLQELIKKEAEKA